MARAEGVSRQPEPCVLVVWRPGPRRRGGLVDARGAALGRLAAGGLYDQPAKLFLLHLDDDGALAAADSIEHQPILCDEGAELHDTGNVSASLRHVLEMLEQTARRLRPGLHRRDVGQRDGDLLARGQQPCQTIHHDDQPPILDLHLRHATLPSTFRAWLLYSQYGTFRHAGEDSTVRTRASPDGAAGQGGWYNAGQTLPTRMCQGIGCDGTNGS